jgi:peroxiredoxin
MTNIMVRLAALGQHRIDKGGESMNSDRTAISSNPAIDASAEVDHQVSAIAAMRGSGRLPVAGAVPRPGELLRDFTLPAADGTPLRLSELRGQSSLVLILTGALPPARTLQPLLAASHEYEIEDAKLVVIVAAQPGEARSFQSGQPAEVTVLADADAKVHRQAGADRNSSAIYVTDRFGEVFAEWRTTSGDALPPVQEVTRTLRQISLLCPECGFPEWPVE